MAKEMGRNQIHTYSFHALNKGQRYELNYLRFGYQLWPLQHDCFRTILSALFNPLKKNIEGASLLKFCSECATKTNRSFRLVLFLPAAERYNLTSK